ncbi:MAG: hypothetical protein QXS57_02585 [Candidatus Caldarchaeum sp.]
MKRLVAATAVLAAVAALVAGFSAVNALNPSPVHGLGRGRGGPWMGNATTTESVVEGVVVNADHGLIVVSSGGQELRLSAPRLWSVRGETKTWFRLFADDDVNIGDNVRLIVVTISHTSPRGATITIQVVKTITDLSTGVEASAVQRQPPAAPQT